MEFLLAIILVWAVIFGLVAGAWKAKDQAVAKKTYLEALSDLKRAPMDADLRLRALALGRAYAKLSRDQHGRAQFDEVALMKDINAACAAAGENERSDSAMSKGQTLHRAG